MNTLPVLPGWCRLGAVLRWFRVGGNSGDRVTVYDEESIAEYMAGYNDNEENGSKKDWR